VWWTSGSSRSTPGKRVCHCLKRSPSGCCGDDAVSPQDDEKTVNGTASTQKLADKQPGFGSSQNIRAPSAATPPGDKVKQLPEVSDSRLWQLVRPYKLYMLIGAFGAAVAGVVLPLESLLIST